ncbi:uncharacterized protein [Diadema setosum]|uniref:uncharacterized protein n=1 Tax=Diadema setosum TaxID=31175 RepID=UPI003B3BCDFE
MHWKQHAGNELCVVGLGGANGPPIFVRSLRPERVSREEGAPSRSSTRSSGGGGGQKRVKQRLHVSNRLSARGQSLPDIRDEGSVFTIKGTAKALHGNVSTVSFKSGDLNRLSPDFQSLKCENEKASVSRCNTEKDNASCAAPPNDGSSVSSKLFSERSVPTMATTTNAMSRLGSSDLTWNPFTVTPIALSKRGDSSPRSSPAKSLTSSEDEDAHDSPNLERITMPPIGSKPVSRGEGNPKRFCAKPLPMNRHRMMKSFQDTMKILNKELDKSRRPDAMPRELQSGSVRTFDRLIILNHKSKQSAADQDIALLKPQTAPPVVTSGNSGKPDLELIVQPSSSVRERSMVMQLNNLSRKYQQEKSVKFALESSSFAQSHASETERVIPKEEVPREKLVNFWLDDCPPVESSPSPDHSPNAIPRRKIILNVPCVKEEAYDA